MQPVRLLRNFARRVVPAVLPPTVALVLFFFGRDDVALMRSPLPGTGAATSVCKRVASAEGAILVTGEALTDVIGAVVAIS